MEINFENSAQLSLWSAWLSWSINIDFLTEYFFVIKSFSCFKLFPSPETAWSTMHLIYQIFSKGL